MRCPFCAENINDAAVVCKYCRRDLAVSKPILEENSTLRTKLSRCEREVKELRTKLAEIGDTGKPGSFREVLRRIKVLTIYCVILVLSLLITHYIVQISLDLSQRITYSVYIFVTIGFGIAITSRTRFRMSELVVPAICVATLGCIWNVGYRFPILWTAIISR